MKRVLGLPTDTKLEWKSHDSSIQQRSAIEESRREKPNSHHHHNNNHNHQHHQSDKRTGKQSYSMREPSSEEQQPYAHGTP